MDMIQELRAKAKVEGNLNSTDKQKIVVEKETIIIEPADPEVIYVPYYDPLRIYGPWWYPAYPPYYWGPARVSIGVGISYWPAYYFGVAFGSWSYFDWPRHYIYIDVHRRPRYVRHSRWRKEPGRWHHLPAHRRGVAYRDKFTAQKYGQYRHRTRDFRPETRGFPEKRDFNRLQQRDDQRRFDRNTGSTVRRQINRNRQDSPPNVPTRPAPQNNVNNQQDKLTTPPVRVERQRIERGRIKQRTASQPEPPSRIVPETQILKQPVVTTPQIRSRTDQQRQARERIERQQQLRSSDNVFNRVENGSRERKSSTRGRYSRQGWNRDDGTRNRSGNEGFYNRSRSGNDRRDDRGRSRR